VIAVQPSWRNSKMTLTFTSTVVVVVALWLLYKVARWYDDMTWAKKFNCKPVTHVKKDWTMGLKLIKPMLAAKAKGRLLEWNVCLFYDENDPTADTFAMRVAGSKVITTRNPENIKTILATNFNDFGLGVRHEMLGPLLGDGIFTLDGNGWKHSRTMLRPQFAREQVSHVRMLEPHVQALIKHIDHYKQQRTEFDIQDLFFKLTVDSATEFLFGESVNSLHVPELGFATPEHDFPQRLHFAEAFNLSQAYLSKRVVLQGLYWVINGTKFKEVNKTVHEFADHYINKVLRMTESELEDASKCAYIFLYELAKKTRNPKVLRDQALNILLAGRDTTAGLLSFTFFELGRNREIFDKLQQEIRAEFGSGTDGDLEQITFESLKKCEYLKAVINEILRLYPVVPKNFREANKPTFLARGGGPQGQDPIFVPKGGMVLYSVHAMHHDPLIYGKDAEVFRPERWFEDSARKLGWAFLPFNGGPRICLGQQFALTEASYVIVRLLQTFTSFNTLSAEYPPSKDNNLTMSLHKGCHVKVE
jgi:cytochrome P450